MQIGKMFLLLVMVTLLSIPAYAQQNDDENDAILVLQSDSLDKEKRFALQASLIAAAGRRGLKLIPPDEVGVYEKTIMDGQCKVLEKGRCLVDLATMALAKTSVFVRVATVDDVLSFQVNAVDRRTGRLTKTEDAALPLLLDNEDMQAKYADHLAAKIFAPERMGKLVLMVVPASATILVDGIPVVPSAVEIKLEEYTQQVTLDLAEGEHEVTTSCPGYTSEQNKIVIRPAAQNDEQVSLTAAVDSSPGAMTYAGFGAAGVGVAVLLVAGATAGFAYTQKSSGPKNRAKLVGELTTLSAVASGFAMFGGSLVVAGAAVGIAGLLGPFEGKSE